MSKAKREKEAETWHRLRVMRNVEAEEERLGAYRPHRHSRGPDGGWGDLCYEQHPRVTESSGNVFLDLGFPPEEAAQLLALADAPLGPLQEMSLKRQPTV